MRSAPLRLLVSAIAGFLTYLAVGTALFFAAPSSFLNAQYWRVFGLAPFLAHVFDPSFQDVEGLVEVFPIVGERVRVAVLVTSWTLLFGAVYFCYVFRSRRRAI